MFRYQKKVLIILLGIHSILYAFTGDYMLEHEIRSNFRSFNDRRLASESNVEGGEELYFASCGDEFFRNQESLEDFVKEVSPKKPAQFSGGYYRNVRTIDPYADLTELITKVVNGEANATCIIFNVCKVSKLPLLYTKLNQVEVFSSHDDFHSMLYNDQVIEYEIHYVWILFKWFRVAKVNKNQNS